jgi:hypothetical protein
MRRLELKLPDRVRDFLEREAARTGRAMAELIRQYITDRPEFAAAQEDLVDHSVEPAAEPEGDGLTDEQEASYQAYLREDK